MPRCSLPRHDHFPSDSSPRHIAGCKQSFLTPGATRRKTERYDPMCVQGRYEATPQTLALDSRLDNPAIWLPAITSRTGISNAMWHPVRCYNPRKWHVRSRIAVGYDMASNRTSRALDHKKLSFLQCQPAVPISHSWLSDEYPLFKIMAAVSSARSKGLQDTKADVKYVENVAVDNQKLRDIETVALVVTEPRADFKLQAIILDEIRDDEVLVEMKYSGICHTDIVLQQGLLPMIEFPAVFGHEGAGFVRGVGSRVKNKSLNVGDAVLLSFNTCGTCKPCANGHPAFCHTHAAVNHNAVRLTDRSTPARTKDGQSVRSQYFGHSSFAKMSVVNEKCVVKCDYLDQMEIYAPIGCGFQTGAGTILNVLKPGWDDSLVIFGLGSVGLTALMAARHIGVGQIIAVDIVQQKLQMARELGATDTINSKEQENVVEAIKKASKTGAGATFALDCTGVLRVIEDMVACLAPQGTAAVVGVPPPGAKVSIDPLMFLLDNKKLIGVIEGDSEPENFIPQLIELHQKGAFPIEKLCRTYPVERLKDAIHDLHTGNVIKPVIQWS